METIALHNLLPEVFLPLQDQHKGRNIWLTDTIFRRGERYLVNAESGAGKTSLCSFIYGLRTDFNGEILFDGKPVRDLTPSSWAKIRTTSLAYVPQNLALFPEMTVIDNIMLKNSMTGFLSKKQIQEMLERCGIEDKIHTPARLLSLGQQQRVAIIRALCQPMDFLLLDEPVSHLDESNNLKMAEMINETLAKTGAGLIATSVGNPLIITPVIPLTL